MEIIPKKPQISVNWGILQTGSESVDDTKQSLDQVYQEIVEINGCVIAELAGDVRNTYASASEKTEAMLKSISNKMERVSDTLVDFKLGTMKIDTNAGLQAGGKDNG